MSAMEGSFPNAQEYLDREDNYGIIIFVDENLALINTVIDVNDWIIHINEIEL